jgi:hypothetical protein
MWHHPSMLFTPKKYGKDWTRFLGLSFCAASLGFALFAILAPWTDDLDLSDRIFTMLGFILAAIVFGALGRDQLKKASEMSADEDRNR